MANPHKVFDRIEFCIVKITLLLLALIGAVKLILLEVKSFFNVPP